MTLITENKHWNSILLLQIPPTSDKSGDSPLFQLHIHHLLQVFWCWSSFKSCPNFMGCSGEETRFVVHALFYSVLDLLIRHEIWVLFILIYPFVPWSGHIFLLFLWLVVESSSCVFSPPSKTSSFSVVSSHPLSFHFFLFPSPSVHVESPFKNKFLHSPKPPTPIFHCNWWLCQLVTVCACAMNVRERQNKFYCYIFLVNWA